MNVIWAPQAKKDFWNNIDYLEAEWSENVAANFIEKVDHTILLLKNNNVLFIKTNYKNELQKRLQTCYNKTNFSLLHNRKKYYSTTSFLEQLPRFRKLQIIVLILNF